MKALSLIALVIGLTLMVYSVFSRFYGEPSIAMGQFKSTSFLVLSNSVLLVSLILAHYHRYK